MRYSTILGIILLLLQIAASTLADESPQRFLSPNIAVRQNSVDRIALSWKVADPTETSERIILFVPGPVSSATYTVSRFTWKSVPADGAEKKGDETTFPRDNKLWEPPRINFREMGLVAGARVAVLELNTSTAITNYSSEQKETVSFPDGEIEIRFSATDPAAFENLPKAIDEIARKLVCNYPPLRANDSEFLPDEQPSYFAEAAGVLRTRAQGILSIPGETFLKSLGGQIPIEELALYRDRKPMPFTAIDTQGKRKTSGSIAPYDWIQYYSPVSSSPYSPETAVWFARVPKDHREPLPLAASDVKPAPEILEQRVLLEEDRLFIEDSNKNETQAQFWMWHDFIQEGTKTISFSLPGGLPPRSATASVRLCSNQSYIYPATDALYFEVNSQKITAILDRSKLSEFSATLAIAPDWLKPGTNTIVINVQFEKRSAQSDSSFYLDKIDLRVFVPFAVSQEPYGNPEHKKTIALPPRTGGIWMVRNQGADPADVYYAPAGAGGIEIADSTDSWQLYALPARPAISPVTLEIVPSPLKDHPLLANAEGADVILIAPRDWLPLLQPVENHLRESHDRVRTAAMEDIDALFGDGRLSPFHLRDFLRFAYHRWQRPHPSYILLVGDASWDYWSRYNIGVRNYVPAYREVEKYAVENWFVRCDVPSDKLPDSIIARWPVQSATDLNTVIGKTLQYKTNPPIDPWFNKVFVLTDDTFEKYTQELIDDWIPPSMRTIRRHIADYPLMDNIYLPERLRVQMRAKTSPRATDEIIQLLSQGVFLWDYFGHGAPNVLGEERMFFGGGSKYSDARKLTNQTKLPMLWAFTCQTAEFDYPREKWNVSIGEDMLTFPGGGMIALIGATGRGYPTDHLVLARGMHQAAFRDRLSTLGQIFFAANLYGLSQMPFFEPASQFVILGDPTIAMPEFVEMQGEARRNADSISFNWKRPPDAPNPGRYTVWAETNSEILTDSETYQFAQSSEIEGVFQTADLSKIHKMGVDSIERKNSKVIVTHGSVSIPADKPLAASFIEPVTGRLPDLTFVPDSLKFSPEKPRSGETVFLNAVVRNDGQASAASISIQGHDIAPDKALKLLTVTVGKPGAVIDRLDPGQEAPVQIRWDSTGNTGARRLRVTVDSDKQIPETNEENNSIEADLNILRKSDLIVDATTVVIRPIEGGKRLQLYFEICNQGESPADKIIIELQRKDVGASAPEPYRIPQAYELKPGERRVFGGVKMPANIEYLEIILDPDELVDEESHENNKYRYAPGLD